MKKHPSELSNEERTKIYQFMTTHPVAVLATVDSSGDPQASVVYVSADETLRIRFTTKQGTRKYANITAHPIVALVAYDASGQTIVQISGRAVEIHDHEERRKVYEGTLQAAGRTGADKVPPIAKIPAGEYTAFEIEADDVRLTDYGWGDSFLNAMNRIADDPVYGGDPA